MLPLGVGDHGLDGGEGAAAHRADLALMLGAGRGGRSAGCRLTLGRRGVGGFHMGNELDRVREAGTAVGAAVRSRA